MSIRIGLVDDHQLFMKSLSLMLETLGQYEIVLEALNGTELQQKMPLLESPPDIMLIDVNMPVKDGVETSRWISEQYPAVRLIALSMNDREQAIINMFKAGCCAYLLKDCHPAELEKAIREVMEKGYYNAGIGQLSIRKLLAKNDEITLTAKELQFLKLACSELTYKEIADRMHLTERTIDGYRETLFRKFNVVNRVGLCLEALRKEFVSL